MKRRQRRPVLELKKSQTSSHVEHLQNKYKLTNNENHMQNQPANSLANLLCHYNSDSDTEDSKKDCKLDDQVDNFFKEIQLIAPKEAITKESNSDVRNASWNGNLPHHINQQALKWRECIDESSGYPYYWHTETNAVTWEMPEELRYLKNSVKTNSVTKPLSGHESHWVDFSSVTYQQSHENIPEGMIPREVVARNRNRYVSNDNVQKQETQTDHDTINISDTMENDSDDGKIEMITSYGSEETDSDTGDEKDSKEEATCTSRSKSKKLTSKLKGSKKCSSPTPQLATVSQNQNRNYDDQKCTEHETSESLNSKSAEDTETKYLKDQVKQQSRAQESESCSGDLNTDNLISKGSLKKSCKRNSSDMDFCISLVPGYDEDSDAEQESETKQERKALFPILQITDTMEATSLSLTFMTDDSQMTDSKDSDVNLEKRKAEEQDISNKCDNTSETTVKSEDDTQKGNKFLDNLHVRSKFFQRKKRIAFEVPSSKPKMTEEADINKPETEEQREEVTTRDGNHREPPVDQSEESNSIIENVEENTQNSKDDSSTVEEEINIQKAESELKENEADVNALSQIIVEKLKFLSEGKSSVSPVQMMSIQLQTLLVAWEQGCLEKCYLHKWLTNTSHELERLEQDAAPPGWLCQWDRSHNRYYYQNTTSGVTQWTYPDTGIAGGAEEMEICSTPPPSEQEEIDMSDGLRSKPRKQHDNGEVVEDMLVPRNSDVEAPPLSQISNPSPPPLPKIYVKDSKKQTKKQDIENENLESKEQEETITSVKPLDNLMAPVCSSALLSSQPGNIANVTITEPLPPGVDLTEAPYELPATALKRIIYGTMQPQGTTLYDASTRDPTVPILSHPAAIMQEHYLQYPAYHQHLHSPATLVLSHKHSVQPAIQLIPDYTQTYVNHKVIEKPPVKTTRESLVSALDLFYNDIARIENVSMENVPQRQDSSAIEPPTVPVEEVKVEIEQEQPAPVEIAIKEKKRKRARVGVSKKHKEVSSMVAKWQKVQQNLGNI